MSDNVKTCCDNAEDNPVSFSVSLSLFISLCRIFGRAGLLWFLADRTNGRAIVTLLRLSSSVVCL